MNKCIADNGHGAVAEQSGLTGSSGSGGIHFAYGLYCENCSIVALSNLEEGRGFGVNLPNLPKNTQITL